jgi:hypothetical protein
VPEISLLQPTVLNGFVRRKPFPQNLLGLRLMGARQGYPFPNWAYDIVQGNQLMSKPNVPNQEAHIRPQGGVGNVAGSFIYMRDKKPFTPTALHWLRTPGELAANNARLKVAEEVSDLDDAIERFAEWSTWQMLLTGTLVVNRPDAPRVNINYQIPSDHFVTPSVLWTTIATATLPPNVNAWKLKVQTDSNLGVRRVFLNSTTLYNTVYMNAGIQNLLSDEMRDEFLRTGVVKGLLGLDWVVYDNTYTDDWTTPGTPVTRFYIPDYKILFLAEEAGAYGIMEGPTADDEAPAGNTGKFAKTWKEKDPSTRLVLEEYPFIPILPKPDNVLVATVG